MDALQVAKLKFSRCQTCFISIPREWLRLATSSNEEVVVYEISAPQGDTVTHACWSGTTTDDNTVEINDCFAHHCGLRHDQEVFVQRICESVHRAREVKIRPSSATDFAKLAASGDTIEFALMRSTRVVWRGMTFPIWISPTSPPVSVYVESVSPDCSLLLLVQNCKLEILPADSLTQGANPYGSRSPRSPPDGRGGIFSYIGNILWRGGPPSQGTSSELMSDLSSASSVPREQQAEVCLTWKSAVSFSARVIPRKHLPCTQQVEGGVDKLLHEHPTTVFVSRTLLGDQDVGDHDSAVTFAAAISKIASPREKQEKAAASDTKGPSNATKVKNRTQANLPDCETCFVRIFVVPVAWDAFQSLHGTDFVLVADTLRRQLGLDYASRVEVKSLAEDERPVPVLSVALHPLGWQASATRGQSIPSTFRAWCRDVSSAAYPVVLSSGGLLRLPHSSGPRDYLVKLSQQRSDAGDAPNGGADSGGDSPKFCFLRDASNVDVHLDKTVDPQPSNKCKLELPVSNISSLNPDLQAPKLEELG